MRGKYNNKNFEIQIGNRIGGKKLGLKKLSFNAGLLER